jgi:hypothetical protein
MQRGVLVEIYPRPMVAARRCTAPAAAWPARKERAPIMTKRKSLEVRANRVSGCLQLDRIRQEVTAVEIRGDL